MPGTLGACPGTGERWMRMLKYSSSSSLLSGSGGQATGQEGEVQLCPEKALD